jgi:hypothetical protein
MSTMSYLNALVGRRVTAEPESAVVSDASLVRSGGGLPMLQARKSTFASRLLRTRGRVPRRRYQRSPGMQHTLERDAVRVNAAPWLF